MQAVAPAQLPGEKESSGKLAELYRELCKATSRCDKSLEELEKQKKLWKPGGRGDGTAPSTDLGSSNYGTEPSDSSSDSIMVASEEGSTEWGSNYDSEPVDSSSDSPAARTELSEEEFSSSGHDSKPSDDSLESTAAQSEVLEDLLAPSDSFTTDAKLLEEESPLSCSPSTCGNTKTGATVPEETRAFAVEVQPWLCNLFLATAAFLSTLTTVVVKGLPPHSSRKLLLERFQLSDGSIDFLEVPWNTKLRRQCQYCFINFTSHWGACAFWDRWNGRCLAGAKKQMPLNVVLANVQGLRALVYQYLACKNSKYPPIVFDGEQQIDFPELLARLGIQREE